MIIVLPAKTSGEKSFISENFGRANYFYVYDTEKEVGETYINEYLDSPHGVGIKSAEFVLKHKTDVIIAPRVGEKSMELLQGKVKVYLSTDSIIKDNIKDFLEGKLKELI
ncbi:MAG: NifB/NifX family molybdenum-iron cluster-binding protein [Candidatus Izemoplasmatales bacterium]|jgi:predicted Fe-Mo cluster-binding NifX family protein|nr:NifB/NifX family molybdenum-iron cluster-binding protein [Candidatus Izemoplasmatales bacterium]